MANSDSKCSFWWLRPFFMEPESTLYSIKLKLACKYPLMFYVIRDSVSMQHSYVATAN